MTRRRHCPPLDRLLAADAGALSDAAASGHLATCASCAALVRDFAAAEELDIQPAEQERIRSRVFEQGHRSLMIPLAIAAAIVVAIVGLSFFAPKNTMTTEEPLRRAPVTTATAIPPPAPIPQPELEPAPVRLPSSMLTWRNDADRVFAEDFGAAIALYRKADYAGAATQFERVIQQHPPSAEAHFYLGVSQLFLQRPAEAIESLRRARELDRGALTDLIDRYLAVASTQLEQR